MKKILLTVLLLIFSITILAGCGSFGNDSNNNQNNIQDNNQNNNQNNGNQESEPPKPTSTTITVYNDSASTEYTVKFNNIAQINVPYRPNKYFTGAYDKPAGGTQYFDNQGKSTLVWTADLPTTLYSHFGDISDLNYSATLLTNNPFFYNGNSTNYFLFKIDSVDFMNGIKGNLSKKLRIQVSYDLSCTNSWPYNKSWITNSKSGGERMYIISSSPKDLTVGKYDKISEVIYADASKFAEGNIYLFTDSFTNITTGRGYYYQNIKISVSFE